MGNELTGTHQGAATHHRTAALRAAETDAADDPAEQHRLRTEAAQTHTLTDTPAARAAQPQQVHDTRARWLTHTTASRARAERAAAELGRRHDTDTEPEQLITAQSRTTKTAASPKPKPTSASSTTTPTTMATRPPTTITAPRSFGSRCPSSTSRRPPPPSPPPSPKTSSACPPRPRPLARSTTPTALAEIRTRDVADQQREAEDRAAELSRCHAEDHTTDATAEHDDIDSDVFEHEPVDA